ncbi:hypothetical protein CH367_12090 [Leptospira barantonii]|uniref:Uncharacterized protein n=1 Tax=Leptospira barantonii TaxID=2023184 RepID=A0ABX4NJ60_9LEPT|nr:hypothetical protein CH367_12090 [Leptospira barantonii]
MKYSRSVMKPIFSEDAFWIHGTIIIDFLSYNSKKIRAIKYPILYSLSIKIIPKNYLFKPKRIQGYTFNNLNIQE